MFERPLIGRGDELTQLRQGLEAARAGRGTLMLIAGEAGIGKTRLAEEALREGGLLVLRNNVTHRREPPYGSIISALRHYLHRPDAVPIDLGPLSRHLALLLPELGQPATESDRDTLFEVVRQAFVTIARRQPLAVFLDDLQWADSTTLELLPALAGWLDNEPLVILATYRIDEIPRGHPLRRMRTDLRRAGRLHEIALSPLDSQETALLAAQILGDMPGPSLRAAIYDRTQGVSFFVEELATALLEGGRLARRRSGLELSENESIPVPDTIRDAVLLRTEGLTPDALDILEVASVAGVEFDLDLVAELAGDEEGLVQPIERGLIVETGPGRASFRHDLTREAIYDEITWPRKRTLHRQIAARLDVRGFPPAEVAEHWLLARDFKRGARALIASAEASCLVHAYPDAMQAYRRALDALPDTEDEATRINALKRLAECAELCGELSEAVRVWHEVVQWYESAGELHALAEAQRRLATAYELEGASVRATSIHQAAAESFAAVNQPAEAASERIAASEHLEAAANYSSALALAELAGREADQARRPDLKALSLGLEGQARANLGNVEQGLELIRKGLSLALEQNLTSPAAVIYFQLATTLDQASDYPAARDAYLTAIDYCQTHGESKVEKVCLACFSVVLRQTGEWDRAIDLCRDVLATEDDTSPARAVAAGILGCIQELRGTQRKTHQLLRDAHTFARRHEIITLEIESAGSLILAESRAGDTESAIEYCQLVRDLRANTEERHYAITPLRWAASFYAARGDSHNARACAHALAGIASSTGNPEALSGLSFTLGECAALEGDTQQAISHFSHSLELLSRLELPFIRAQTQVRTAIVHAEAGQKSAAIELFTRAYRTAKKLKARPLATQAASELEKLGEVVERRLGRRAAGQLRRHGITPRELEVLRLISLGRTSREIARELFLSPRTVEMHVSNIMAKLDCRSRAEATYKAHDLKLLSQEDMSV